MASMWVMRPGDEQRLPEVQEVAAKLQGEIKAIESLGDEATCHLCGDRATLTTEHTPSKKAGNPRRAIGLMIDLGRSVASGWLLWRSRKVQGVTVKTLCRSCNNNTGKWYNPAYVRLVQHCRNLARPENAGKLCEIDLEIHPQRVLKQALTSIVATSQPGLTVRYPRLREFLTGAETLGPIEPIHVWFYLLANKVTRQTGLVAQLIVNRGVGQIRAEFSSWPLGWITTLDDQPIEGAVDVSAWSEVGYHEKVRVKLQVPCQWALTPYPGDFGSPGDVLGRAQGGPR